MSRTLTSNIFYSFVEKVILIVFQLISSILLSRFLPREDFGVLGVVAGIFTFVQFLNVSFESILIRSFEEVKDNPSELMGQIFAVNRLKAIVLIFVGCITGAGYAYMSKNWSFLLAALSYSVVLIMDVIVAPFITYASLSLNQKIVSRMTFLRWAINVLFLLVLVKYPNLLIVLLKDIFILILVLYFWNRFSKTELKITNIKSAIKFNYIKKWFLDYSFWVHLISSSTNVIYRIDAFILYYFISIKDVGNYNVALAAANVANIIPGILAYQNTVAVSRSKSPDEIFEVTGLFVRLSVYVSLVIFLAYFLLGRLYLKVMTGNQFNEEVFVYLINIVAGLLIVKTLIAPLVSYINVKGDVKSLFLKVKLPILIITICNYVYFAKNWGAIGVSVSNIINACIWAVLVYVEIKKYSFKISHIMNFKQDYLYLKKTISKDFILSKLGRFR